MLPAADVEGNPVGLIDPPPVRPSIKRGPGGPVRNTLFRGKLVNQPALHRSLMESPARRIVPVRRPNARVNKSNEHERKSATKCVYFAFHGGIE